MLGPVFEDESDDWKHALKVTVITAACTALVTEFIEWGVAELKHRYGAKPKPKVPPQQ